MNSTTDKAVSYPSREASSNRPHLVLEFGAGSSGTVTPTQTPPSTPPPTATPTGGSGPGTTLALCGLTNAAWTDTGKLLRGGAPSSSGLTCLANYGLDVIIDQRTPSEAGSAYDDEVRAAGIEYLNLGIPDDTAPSPSLLQQWMDTVEDRLAQGKLVLVHDRAGRGRMGFWDAVYWMQHGLSAQRAIEDRYLAKTLAFSGAKIGCSNGGNGQVQALYEVAHHLTGQGYWPSVDEYGTTWANCPRPSYMNGWNYTTLVP
jgi:hypothetical protein